MLNMVGMPNIFKIGTRVLTSDLKYGIIAGLIPCGMESGSLYYLVELVGMPELVAIEEFENNEIYPSILPYHESSLTAAEFPRKWGI